jgi:predicted amidohydrolase YtcJ
MTHERVPNATSADLILRVGAIHPFDGQGRVYRSLAVRDGRILAVDARADGLEDLRGPQTRVLDGAGWTLLPAFHDTHNHQLFTGLDQANVSLLDARDIGDVVAALAARCQATPPGEWVVSSRCWHETNLREGRLPTARELDAASTAHPVCVRRGGHVVVVNSLGLERAGIDEHTPDPPGGSILRDGSGRPLGPLIEFPAFAAVEAQLPKPTFADRVAALENIGRRYNARGLGSVRDPGLTGPDLQVYQTLWEQGRLTVRTRVMVRLDPRWDQATKLAEVERWGLHTGFGDDWLRLDGIKVLVDGGVEGGALSADYANRPGYRGHLFIGAGELAQVALAAVERGWRVGCHAVGDVALDTVLDAYEEVVRRHPGLKPGTLTVEHAFFADARQRARAIRLGVAVTVQHPLLQMLGGNMVIYWGRERAEQVMPIRAWVEEGALVSAGTDSNVASFDPLRAIWGMVTRGTAVAGRLGADQAVSRETAFELYTVAGARYLGELDRRGPLAPGRLADLVAFRTDPLTCPVDDLPDLAPALTLVGGRAVWDPEGLLG